MAKSSAASADLIAGAATGDITPTKPTFLFGYPHTPRTSTGVHDPLECAALYLKAGSGHALFVAHDIICLGRPEVTAIRRRIHASTGVPEDAIMLTATHTHSGPIISNYVSNAADPVVPKADPAYLAHLIDRVVATAEQAVQSAVAAEVGHALASGQGIGTNRHDPAGPADLQVPVMIVRAANGSAPMAVMLVCAMHTTVLHEDSTLVSSDFPHYTRQYLRAQLGNPTCTVLFHQGASGNQSPRHVTRGNTFAEAQRLGEILGRGVADAVRDVQYAPTVQIRAQRTTVDAVQRKFPAPDDAVRRVVEARAHYARLKAEGAPRPTVRTAECDVFGAEETAELAKAAVDGRLAAAIAQCLPAEIQAITIGARTFVAWPGEFFVEFALEVRRRSPETFVVTLANGELQGYVVTEEAAERGYYEANNALFAPVNGRLFVESTLALIGSAR